jgi:hypothetical protein
MGYPTTTFPTNAARPLAHAPAPFA